MPSVLISGPPGAGTTTASKLVAARLKIGYFSPGQLFKDIALGKIKSQFYYPLFKKMCDAAGLKIPEMKSSNNSLAAADLWKTDFGKNPVTHKLIDKMQALLAEDGNIVIDGKLALFIIKKADLKVWLKADIRTRAKRTSRRDGLKQDFAEKVIKDREDEERENWKKIYGLDYFTQENLADLVIDTSHLTPEKVTEEILANL